MKLIMHDENQLINQKMIELTSISANHLTFSPLKSMDMLASKRKYRTNGNYCPRLTSASSDISNEEHPNDCEDEYDDSRSTFVGNGDLNEAEMKISNGDINLPSPPNSSRSSFDNDLVTRDSFLSNGDNSVVSDMALYGSYVQEMVFEENNEVNDQENSDSFEDDIKLVAENLVQMVSDEFKSNESKLEDALWESCIINEVGETILPSGLRLTDGVAEMPFYRENNSEPSRFTNQLNYLKTILTKYICRYKSAMPFLNPVDCVRLKIPHYYQVVRKPMDLTTVKNRINFLWYRDAAGCISDLRLMFSNCYNFNSPTDYVYKAGQKLEEYLNEKLKDLPAIEVEIPCPPVPSFDECKLIFIKLIFFIVFYVLYQNFLFF